MLKTSGKKILLTIHITMVSIWLGSLTSILLLQIGKRALTSAHFFLVDRFIFAIFDSVIMYIAIAVAISGLLFSMFTNWGFFKFHWITIKWITIFLLAGIIIFLASPSINSMAAISDIFRHECESNLDYLKFESNVVLFTAIQLVTLVLLILLSVFKPWGARKQRFKVNRKIIISSGLIIGALLIVGNTMQYLQLNHYRHLPLSEITLTQVADGIYPGRANYGFEYEVRVHVKNHAIENIEILKNRDSFYARLAEGIKHKIIRAQQIHIDAVTGATTTSKILMKAVEDALLSGNE
ncbi:FMN-binding protein [Caldithrix abyssi]